MFAGTIHCTESEGCCLYAGPGGVTLRAELGDVFHDGCNSNCECTKTAMNRGPWKCETDNTCSCRYDNWELVGGYAFSGETVPTFDRQGDKMSGHQCPKFCTCRPKLPGEEEEIDCENQSCVYF